jgi:parvulin-like peptidyl-prolyl isomerase
MSSTESVETLRTHISELLAKPECDAQEIQVQHLLVSFNLAGIPGIVRTKEQAEEFASELWAEIQAGTDFDKLVKKNTDDSHPGVYSMTTGKPGAGVYARGGMVAAFGNIGWRLEVGAVGVAGFDQGTSPYGWHIIRRLK